MTTTIYNAASEPLYEVSAFTFSEADMGEASITCDIYLPQEVDPQFSLDWYIDYKGEKFYLSTLQPPAIKDNSLIRYKYSLTFKSEREDLKRYDMLDIVKSDEGDPIPDKYSFSFQGDITQFVDRFNANLQYNFGARWEMRLAEGVTSDSVVVSCQDGVKLWDLLTQVYDLYGIRWYIASEDDTMVIFVGYTPTEIAHIFEYDPDKPENDTTGGLYSIERVNPLNDIYTRMRGTGGTKNLPYRYFKAKSQVESEQQYPADPDYNAVIANNNYSNLMPKCFRDYLKGWNGTALSPETEAYTQGKADKLTGKFKPVDYVISEKESKWGIKYGGLQANEKIYPTIQGVWDDQLGRIDEIVAVSDVPEEESVEDSSTPTVIAENVVIPRMDWYTDGHAVMASRTSEEFELTGDKNTIKVHLSALRYNVNDVQIGDDAIPVYVTAYIRDVETDVTFNLIEANTNLTAEGIDGSTILPAGRYVVFVKAQPQSPHTKGTAGWASVTVSDITAQPYSDSTEVDLSQTFNIWIKDVGFDIREPQYWAVDQGDMAVMFSDGLLAGEDYEFTIAAEKNDDTYTKIYVAEDTSKSIQTTNEQGDPITVQSKWRITLIRSDVEYDASGRLIPNDVVNAKAGDHFFFINIQLPQKYVEWAEERLQSYIAAELSTVDDEYPTFTVKPSAIFCADFAEADKLRAGARIKIRNQRLIGDGYLIVYITSLTLTHSQDKVLPTWDMVVSETPSVSQNAVSLLQGQIEVLSRNVASSYDSFERYLSLIDSVYVRGDGLEDTSYSPTTFKSTIIFDNVTRFMRSMTLADIIRSDGFRQAGFAGSGWGIFKDANGNWTLEIDRINLRKDLSVNKVTVNQLSFLYGKYIYARGGIAVTEVEEIEGGHKLYFDTENGNHPNPFVVNDQAYSLNFNTEAYEVQKYYWALVTEVGTDYIVISATDKDGDGVPMAGDNVAQFGNRTDIYRQQALVMDQIEGGSIVQYAHIGDPNATDGPFSLQDRAYAGFEYDPATGEPRMFSYGDLIAGDRNPLAEEAEYIRFTKEEDEDRRTLKIKAQVSIKAGSSGLTNLVEWQPVQEQLDAMGYITEALKGSTTISGGLILTSLISLLDQDGATKSGINGIYDASKLGGGIAAWYGGNMLDKFDYYYWDDSDWTLKPKPDVEIPDNIAQGLDRMDGTGYRAGGNFWWDADGNIHADTLSFFVGEENVGNMLALFRLNYKSGSIDKPFSDVESVTPMRKFTGLQIGEALIEWDDTNNALVFRTADRSGYVGFYGEYTSAKGANPDAGQGGGGGGATALSQLNDVLLSQPASGDLLSYNGSKWVNIKQSSITPDLSGYATQSWVKQQGYLTDIPAEYITETELNAKGYALSTTKVVAGTGLTGGGALTGNVTLSLASRTLWGQTYNGDEDVSGALSYVGNINFSNDAFYLKKQGAESFILALDANNLYLGATGGSANIGYRGTSELRFFAGGAENGVGTQIGVWNTTGLGIGTANPAYKLDVAGSIRLQNRLYFDPTHYIELDSNGYFHFSHGVYSDSFVSALGLNPGMGGGGGGSYDRLDTWGEYTSERAGWVLSAALGYDLHSRVSSLEGGSALSFTTEGTGNVVTAVKKSGTAVVVTKGLTALTSHQPIYALNFQAGAFEAKKYTPNTGAQTVNIPTKTSHIYDDVGYMYHYRANTGTDANDLLRISNAEIMNGINMPTMNIWHNVVSLGTIDINYAVQLATPYNVDGSLYLRHKTVGEWRSWRELIDSANYKSYTVSKTGEGASGTWPIGISGTAAKATSAEASNTTRQLEAFADDTFTNGQHYIKAIRDASGWTTRLWMCYKDGTKQANAVWVWGSDIAVRLQAAHTIWGQTFDGTGPVFGDMKDVGDISSAGQISSTYIHPFRMVRGNYGVFFRQDGDSLYLMLTNANDQYGSYNNLRPLQVALGSGDVSLCSNLFIRHLDGYVGIRISNPAYPLDVNGDARLTGNFRLNGSYLFLKHYQATGGIYFATDTNGDLFISKHTNYAFSGSIGKIVYASGNVGINNPNPAHKLDVAGVIHSTAGIFSDGYMSAKGINTASDMRLKRRMADVALTVRDVAEAPVYRFAWINGGGIDVGSTAQYWGAIVPELIHKLPDGKYYGLDYGKTALLSVIAVARTMQSHEERIAALERENAELKQTLKKYIS